MKPKEESVNQDDGVPTTAIGCSIVFALLSLTSLAIMAWR